MRPSLTVIIAWRGDTAGFGAIWYANVPLPCPFVGAPKAIQSAPACACHSHSRFTVTERLPVPPSGPTVGAAAFRPTLQRVSEVGAVLVLDDEPPQPTKPRTASSTATAAPGLRRNDPTQPSAAAAHRATGESRRNDPIGSPG